MKKIGTPFNLMLIFVFIGILGAATANYLYISRSLKTEAEQTALTFTEQIGTRINHQMEILERVLDGPAALITSGTVTNKTIGNYLSTLNNNNSQFVTLFYQPETSAELVTTGSLSGSENDNRLESWYTLASQDSILTEIHDGKLTEQIFSRPVFAKNGKRIGVLGGIIQNNLFMDLLHHEIPAEEVQVFLIRRSTSGAFESCDAQYQPLVTGMGLVPSNPVQTGQSPVAPAEFQGQSGLFSYQPVPNTPWLIATFTMLAPLESEINQLKLVTLAVLGFCILLMLGSIIYQRRNFTKPLLAVEQHINRVDLTNPELELLSLEDAPQFSGLVGGINLLLYKIRHYSRENLKDQAKLIAFNRQLEDSLMISQSAQNGLMLQKNQFEALFKNSTDGILILNHYHQIIDFNSKFTELFGYKIEALRYCEPDDLLSDELHLEEARELTSTLFSGRSFELETERLTSNGESREVTLKGVPVLLGDEVVGAYLIYNDISVRKRSEYDLKYLSYHDQLTGLYNRRFFEVEMQRLDTERNLPLTILMCDVNGLKITNDAFGHGMGDRLLVRTAEILRRICRTEDIVARWGGDEFVILLPKSDKVAAMDVFERIKMASKDEMVDSIMISISIGFAVKTEIDEITQEVFKDAENRMYSNKLYEGPSMRGQIVRVILNTLHEKNPREESHSRRVSQLCGELGAVRGCTETEVEALRTFGLLHDIGKIAIYENLLNKKTALNDDEWMEMRRHPEIGYRILSAVNEMSEIADLTLAHHENWDGSGYPKGLSGERIPLESRMIQLADAFDAMTSDRPYRKALSAEVAVSEIIKNAGKQFDPELSRLFIERVLNMPWEDRSEIIWQTQ